MEQSQKPRSWKKRIATWAGIYIAVTVILIVAAVLLSTDVPLAEDQNDNGDNFTGLLSSDRTNLLFSGNLVPSTAPTLGNPDAKITIVEFSDFQCPYCKASFSVIRSVLEKYPDDAQGEEVTQLIPPTPFSCEEKGEFTTAIVRLTNNEMFLDFKKIILILLDILAPLSSQERGASQRPH